MASYHCATCSERQAWPLSQLLLVFTCFVTAVIAAPASDEKYGAIGFDFTPSGGTSAVAYKNGSRYPLARIEGSADWRIMQSHLATDLRPRWLHYGSEYVEVMADVIRLLAMESEKILGHQVTAASASIALSSAASEWGEPYTRLIKESFLKTDVVYLEIVPWLTYDEGERLINIGNSVIAGHGLGLCHPYYTEASPCSWEQQLPEEAYLLVGYHANAIEIAITTEMRSAYGIHAFAYPSYHLGANMKHRNPREDFYWEAVWDHIRYPSIKWRPYAPTKVIVYGEHSDDEHFRELLHRMLIEWLPPMGKELPEWVEDGMNATFVGAMGAAEFALRKPFFDKEYNKRRGHHPPVEPQIVFES